VRNSAKASLHIKGRRIRGLKYVPLFFIKGKALWKGQTVRTDGKIQQGDLIFVSPTGIVVMRLRRGND
jgi:hypothetical protein